MTNPGDPITAALQQLLAAQHAAVYSYPVIGVRLSDPSQIERARALEDAHRLTRDELRDQLASRAAEPVSAEPSYQPPTPSTDPAGAQQWAVQLEAACAAGYRYLLTATGVTTGTGSAVSTIRPISAGQLVALREQALAGLAGSAQRATGWRALVDPSSPTVAFPGL